MRLCYIADAASVHSQHLIEFFARNHDVLVLSTSADVGGAEIDGARVVGLGRGAKGSDGRRATAGPRMWEMLPGAVSETVAWAFPVLHGIYTELRCHRALRDLAKQLPVAREHIQSFRPDVVHALRLQTEGFLGARLGWRPLVLSTWGNDFVYWAWRSGAYGRWTKTTLPNVDALVTDNHRDLYLGECFGFPPDRPHLTMPATGGVPSAEVEMLGNIDRDRARRDLGFAPDDVVILSVRGFYRAYTNTPALIEAAAQIAAAVPTAQFVVDGKGRLNTPAHRYLQRRARALGVAHRIRFTSLDRGALFRMMKAADVMVSVVLYDGLPISMLEGMAAGLIPVMSNQSPLLEYIEPGVNGFVADPRNPADIAAKVLAAIRALQVRETIVARNREILAAKADRQRNLEGLEALYKRLAAGRADGDDYGRTPHAPVGVVPKTPEVATQSAIGRRN